MAFTLPLPVRLIAGLVGTGIDRVRALPTDLPALPVVAVGRAMRLTMKLQQEVNSLATRGDELLGGVIAAPQENPAWARFDDDEAGVTGNGHLPADGPGASSKGSVGPSRDRNRFDDEPEAPPAKTPLATTPPLTTPLATTPVATRPLSTAPVAKTPLSTTPLFTTPLSTTPLSTTPPIATSLPPETTTSTTAALEVPPAVVASDLAADPASAKDLPTQHPLARPRGPRRPAGALTPVKPPAAIEPAEPVKRADATARDTARERIAPAGPARRGTTRSGPAGSGTDRPRHAPAGAEAARNAGPPPDVHPRPRTTPARQPAGRPTGISPRPAAGGTSRAGAAAGAAGPGPAALPGYPEMTLAQVRGRLRELSAADVSAVLAHEQATTSRPPFLTLLTNRLVTLDAQLQ